MKKNIVILDQYFKDYQGHHFNYNKYLNDALDKKSYEVEFYFNKKISDEIKNKFDYKIHKLFDLKSSKFKVSNFFLIKKRLINELKKINQIRKLYYFILKRNHFIFNLALKYLIRKKEESEFLKKLFEIDRKHKNTYIFIHSLSVDEFLEFINNVNRIKNNNNKYLIVYRRDPRELKFCLKYISKIFKLSNFNLLTDSHRIKNYFENKKIKTSLINIPIFFKKIKTRKKTKKLNISYLGDARLEKGFFNLPNLINKAGNNFNFLIQANSNGFDNLKYNETIKKLLKFKNIKLIFNELSEQKYLQYLRNSDIILLPYLKDNYKFRTSGIFFETIFANKISIVSKNTWMSSFYEKNKYLKKLILNTENNFKGILDYINTNHDKIVNEIKKIKLNIQKNQRKNNFKKIFFGQEKDKNKNSSFNYVIDDHTINRKNDGNQWGSSFLFNSISSQITSNRTNNTVSILYNKYNIETIEELILKNNFFKKFTNNYFNLNIIESNRYFNLINNKLFFKNYFNINKIKISDYIFVNFHYYNELIKKFSILKRKKIIVIIHDRYELINNEHDNLIDEKNLYYFFVSTVEYNQTNFKNAKKYLLIPHNFKNKNLVHMKNKKKYNFYFVSSGSEVDVKNMLHLLENNEFKNKINFVGEICLKEKFFKKHLEKINFLGFVDNVNKLYSDKSSIFLIPRYLGLGIPIKFLECLKYNSKCLLFGNKEKFGIPSNFITPIFYKKKSNNFEMHINSINYLKVYREIYDYILDNNYKFLSKFRKEIKNDNF